MLALAHVAAGRDEWEEAALLVGATLVILGAAFLSGAGEIGVRAGRSEPSGAKRAMDSRPGPLQVRRRA